MTSAQAVERLVTHTDNILSQDYTHLEDQTTLLHLLMSWKRETRPEPYIGNYFVQIFTSILGISLQFPSGKKVLRRSSKLLTNNVPCGVHNSKGNYCRKI